MWELDYKKSWAPNWCFWTVVLEKTLESPLDCKEIQQVHPKGDQSWVFFGRNDAKAETPVLWPLHEKGWLFEKDSDAGSDWGQEEKGMTEDEMAGWHYRGREFEWTLGVGHGQGGLACCSSWGRKESDTTERLNWTEISFHVPLCSNMDGARHCHTEWNQTKRNIWYHLYAESKKKGSKWTYLQNRNRLTDLENELIVNGRMEGRNI